LSFNTHQAAKHLRGQSGPFGAWVNRNSSYDADACESLGLQLSAGRYWDAELGDVAIEIKKGRSIWIDLVRIAEQVIGVSPDAMRETVTLFLVPDSARWRIQIAHLVPTRVRQLRSAGGHVEVTPVAA
jgi:hypothetical protein